MTSVVTGRTSSIHEKPLEKEDEPGSQLSQKTKIATRNVAEANSGIEVVSTEMIGDGAVAQARFADAGKHAEDQRDGDGDHEDAAAQYRRIGEARREKLRAPAR